MHRIADWLDHHQGLQAGRLSLDNKGAAVDILYDDHGKPQEVRLAAGPAAAQ